MIEKEKVIRAIFSAVDELNQQLPKKQRLEKSVDTFQSNVVCLGVQ